MLKIVIRPVEQPQQPQPCPHQVLKAQGAAWQCRRCGKPLTSQELGAKETKGGQ